MAIGIEINGVAVSCQVVLMLVLDGGPEVAILTERATLMMSWLHRMMACCFGSGISAVHDEPYELVPSQVWDACDIHNVHCL